MILETLRSSGFRWLTSRVKNPSLSSSAVYWTVYIQFLSGFSSWASRYLLIVPVVPGCAEILIFQGRVKLVLLQASSVQCWCRFWQLGWCPSALLLPSPSFLWEPCRSLLLEMLETSSCWYYLQIEVASGGFTQCFSSFPGGNESSERRVINVIGRWKWGTVWLL